MPRSRPGIGSNGPGPKRPPWSSIQARPRGRSSRPSSKRGRPHFQFWTSTIPSQVMVPRLHPRGASFRGACSYLLHDADKADTNDRVSWCTTLNLATKDPNWAWHEMTDTYWAQGALKA